MKFNLFTLFGLGKIRFSASIASLFAVFFYLLIEFYSHESNILSILFFAIVLILTLVLASFRTDYLGKDPREVVIDEFLGMFILLICAGTTEIVPVGILFVVFRILDVYKVWPISALDKNKKSIWFLIDDLALGVILGLLYRAFIAVI